jgi:hypothetical protein
MTPSHGPNNPWVTPAGAPPGYVPHSPGEGPLAKRFNGLGTMCLVLAIVELLNCFSKLVSAALVSSIFAGSLGAASGAPPSSPLPSLMSTATEFAGKLALWEALRALPFAVASGFLIAVALRLRRGERAALFTARAWVWWAFGIIVLSVALQLFVTLPMTLDYERQMMSGLPAIPSSGRGAASLDIAGFMDTWTLISSGISLIVGTMVFATWPIVLRVWADRLLRDTTPEEVQAPGIPFA